MSHHWPEDEAAIRERTRQLNEMFQSDLGATERERFRNQYEGTFPPPQFPHGQLDPGDKGLFRYDVTANPTAQIVRVDFGTPIAAIGLTYDETMSLVEALTAAAFKLRGIRS